MVIIVICPASNEPAVIWSFGEVELPTDLSVNERSMHSSMIYVDITWSIFGVLREETFLLQSKVFEKGSCLFG